jgi:Winged helix DNA-binding domain
VTAVALSDTALNRATLARQMLLHHSTDAAVDAVRHLVGLQAQNPLDPYLALWSRLADFDPDGLAALIEDRSLVRIVVMRGTIHLVTSDDALTLRPLMQPVLDAEIVRHSEFATHLVSVEMAPVLKFARRELAIRPQTGAQLRTRLAEAFPDHHPAALAYACRCLLPLVQIPPRGVWGKTLAVTLAPLEDWVGHPLARTPSIDDVILRYLHAFGPATPADAAAWSRLTGLGEVFRRLRPQLVTFRDDRGRELFDLPDAPRPHADMPVPVRFLPEYDNLLLSHADRSRFTHPHDGALANAVGPIKGTMLVDGRVYGVWHGEQDKAAKRSTVVIEHAALTRLQRRAVEEEAQRLGQFWLPAADTHDVSLKRLP